MARDMAVGMAWYIQACRVHVLAAYRSSDCQSIQSKVVRQHRRGTGKRRLRVIFSSRRTPLLWVRCLVQCLLQLGYCRIIEKAFAIGNFLGKGNKALLVARTLASDQQESGVLIKGIIAGITTFVCPYMGLRAAFWPKFWAWLWLAARFTPLVAAAAGKYRCAKSQCDQRR